jgi:transposase
MSHANACLTPKGRLNLARCVVEDGWSLRRAADRFQVSVPTAQRWASRFRELGEAGMVDRSSRPRCSPNQTHRRVEKKIKHLRTKKQLGPAQIAGRLGMHPSTVHRVITRLGLPKLVLLDQATGELIRGETPVRYEHENPGDLVHVDVKKLGNIPDGGGWRVHGRTIGTRNSSAHRDPTRGRGRSTGVRTWAMPISTTLLMTTPDWPTWRSTMMNKPRPRQVSGTEPWSGSPLKGSSSTVS